VVVIIPEIRSIRGVDYKTLFLQLRDPKRFFASLSLYERLFLPLRSWRSDLVPLHFGAFNERFEEAIEWIEAYRPEIPIRWSEK
jgi:hypothetical protein